MLTVERHARILEFLKQKETATVKEIGEVTKASESTIRRDLNELEKKQQIKRVHGGAALVHQKSQEPTLSEKSPQYKTAKQAIATSAAALIDKGDTVFLDAGTTTVEMIPWLTDQSLVVVTNGIPHVQKLMEQGIETYVVAGKAKQGTGALIGTKAVSTLQEYHFDKCFLGMNGIHASQGYTTPDPEEASVKRQALEQSQSTYVLADASKFGEVSFSSVAALSDATIMTSGELSAQQHKEIKQSTTIKVVPS
ncbi:DeoR family transcriptional regulator [Gracilibacillus halophilus YIM-C55.5]|uniref:DeoR family transcriptional regulator n=1 Tax=Gracilibacillus halophilus YIM-C55.5 TaxID=1308866 RepID=N4WUZ5_9BACI|nr:DeoR/GlpR family DNA-binding transcription regulator [Gracilibacillus halophilus]ENH98165.1 DeoR family transcriptional regulator [Gracilibacillus halophilus YIM-C55.5]